MAPIPSFPTIPFILGNAAIDTDPRVATALARALAIAALLALAAALAAGFGAEVFFGAGVAVVGGGDRG